MSLVNDKRTIIIGLQPSALGNRSFTNKWKESLETCGVEVRDLNLLAADGIEQAAKCDGIMWHYVHTPGDKQAASRLLNILEYQYGIPVFPNRSTRWHFDDKIAQYYLLQSLDAPIPQTWIFWRKADVSHWLESATFPLVFKLSVGASASNVLKVDHAEQARQLVHRMFHEGIMPMTLNEYAPKKRSIPRSRGELRAWFDACVHAWMYVRQHKYPPVNHWAWQVEKDYVYFQEFIPENTFDTRITVIGNRAFGWTRRNREFDFRASGSGHFEHDPSNINLHCVKIAFDISRRAGFQSIAYDFLLRGDQPVITDMSYGYGGPNIFKCPGHWNGELEWVEGHMWPEEAHVIDFLESIAKQRMS